MDKIKKVRQEIERRQKENYEQEGVFAAGRVVEDADILSFLSTLEEEPVDIRINTPTYSPISTEPGKDGSSEKQPVDVEREEIIGLSIMFFLGTHVKHENSVLVRGKGEVTYKEACEWIRRNIAREKSEKQMQEGVEEEIKSWIPPIKVKADANAKEIMKRVREWGELIARHFAEWGAEHAKIDVTDFCKPIDPGIAQCIADHSWEIL